MSPSINYGLNINGAGASINQTVTRNGDGVDVRAVSLAAGIAGELTTRTSGTAGIVTVAGIGSITTSTPVDIYWAGGIAYGATVTATTSTTITFDAASGAALPSADTAVVICLQTAINFCVKGTELVLFAAEQAYASNTETASSHVDFQDASAGEVLSLALQANVPVVSDVAGGAANPLTGGTGNPVTKAMASNGSAVYAATLNLISLVNSTL